MPRPKSPHAYTRKVIGAATGRKRREMSAAAGRLVRAARLRAGLSQEGLAARTAEVARGWQTTRGRRRGATATGISQATISRLETGSRAPSIRTARLLIEALGLGRRDPLRKALLGEVSRSKRAGRRVRSRVRRSAVLRLGVRALGGTVNHATGRLQAAEAKRLRQLGRRQQKGGMPRRRARRRAW